MFGVLLATYGTVLFAEMLGDKSIYTISSLTTRFRSSHVLSRHLTRVCGEDAGRRARGAGHRAAPARVDRGRERRDVLRNGARHLVQVTRTGAQAFAVPAAQWTRAVAVSFAAIFFTEWADVGQIAAAALAARYQQPLLVWLGATTALVTKGVLAITLGVELRKRVPPQYVRFGAVTLCLALGILAAFRID